MRTSPPLFLAAPRQTQGVLPSGSQGSNRRPRNRRIYYCKYTCKRVLRNRMDNGSRGQAVGGAPPCARHARPTWPQEIRDSSACRRTSAVRLVAQTRRQHAPPHTDDTAYACSSKANPALHTQTAMRVCCLSASHVCGSYLPRNTHAGQLDTLAQCAGLLLTTLMQQQAGGAAACNPCLCMSPLAKVPRTKTGQCDENDR